MNNYPANNKTELIGECKNTTAKSFQHIITYIMNLVLLLAMMHGYRFNKIVNTKEVDVADRHNFNVLNDEFILSSLHTKSKDFISKIVAAKMQEKRRQRTKRVGSMVQTSDEYLFGCLCLCFAVVLCRI